MPTLTMTYPPQIRRTAGLSTQSVTVQFTGATPAGPAPVTASAGAILAAPAGIAGQLVSFDFVPPATGDSVIFTDTVSGATVTVPIVDAAAGIRCLRFGLGWAGQPDDQFVPRDPDGSTATFGLVPGKSGTVYREDTGEVLGPPVGTPLIRDSAGVFHYGMPVPVNGLTYVFAFTTTMAGLTATQVFLSNPPPPATDPTSSASAQGEAGDIFLPGAVAGCGGTGPIIAGSTFVLLARVLGVDGYPITAAGVTSIVTTVFNIPEGTSVTVGSPSDLSKIVFSPLRQDARWTEDRTGYNVALPMPGTTAAKPARTYQAVAVITTAGGDVFKVRWDLQS